MMKLCSEVLRRYGGRTIATAESCTGGGIGAALTAVPGSSSVYKGGIVSYTNWVKEHILGVDGALLEELGAVSGPVAQAMADGARLLLQVDTAVSVTGLAGPGGDEFGNSVGTVFIGASNSRGSMAREYHFSGSRDAVRLQAVRTALELLLEIS